MVEGGGMRAAFVAGVLDALSGERARFSRCYGVSAGAMNLISWVGDQPGRNLDIYLGLCRRAEFISLTRFLRGGHLFDLDWFFSVVLDYCPLDRAAVTRGLAETPFTVVCTSYETGAPVYHRLDPARPERWADSMKASAALPVVYRGPVRARGAWLMDGGMADPLPVRKAVEEGATEVVLVRTRPADYRKKADWSAKLIGWSAPAQFAGAVRRQPAVYNATLAWVAQPPPGVRVTQIAPPAALACGRATQDRAAILEDYHLGRRLGRQWSDGQSA